MHPQVLFVQLMPGPQVTSQVPQCAALVVMSTQSWPHLDLPTSQSAEHLALEHARFAAQAEPQAPQFAPLDLRSTQVEPHAVKPVAHCTGTAAGVVLSSEQESASATTGNQANANLVLYLIMTSSRSDILA